MADFIIGAGAILSAILVFTPQRSVDSRRLSWSRIWFVLAFLAFVSFGLARQVPGAAGVIFASLAGTAYAALLPVQYLFVRAFCGVPAKHLWPHAILPLLNVALSIFLAAIAQISATDGVFNSTGFNLRWTAALTLVVVLVAMLYPLASLRHLIRARAAHKLVGGNRAARHFNWLIVWCGSTLVIGAVAILSDAVEFVAELPPAFIAVLTFGMLCAQLVILGTYVTRNVRAFEAVAGKPVELGGDREALSQFLKRTEAFREPGLSLESLADKIGWRASRLSTAIRATGTAHFNEYINAWRIDHVAGQIKAGAPETVLDLAMDAGFGSKSTFNEAFKRRLGVTPSEFRKQVRAAPPASPK